MTVPSLDVSIPTLDKDVTISIVFLPTVAETSSHFQVKFLFFDR